MTKCNVCGKDQGLKMSTYGKCVSCFRRRSMPPPLLVEEPGVRLEVNYVERTAEIAWDRQEIDGKSVRPVMKFEGGELLLTSYDARLYETQVRTNRDENIRGFVSALQKNYEVTFLGWTFGVLDDERPLTLSGFDGVFPLPKTIAEEWANAVLVLIGRRGKTGLEVSDE